MNCIIPDEIKRDHDWGPDASGDGHLGGTHLPARLDVVVTAKLLGFAEHDIQVLMAVGRQKCERSANSVLGVEAVN